MCVISYAGCILEPSLVKQKQTNLSVQDLQRSTSLEDCVFLKDIDNYWLVMLTMAVSNVITSEDIGDKQ